jgi:kumamolisin
MAHVPLRGSRPPAPPKDRVLEAAPANATVRLSLIVKATAERSTAEIDARQKRLDNLRVHLQETRPRERRYLRAADLAKEHGADDRAFERVYAFARDHGLRVDGTLAAMRQIVLEGRVSDVERAFHVQLQQHRQADRVYYSHEGAVHVPEELQDVIETVVGLHTEPMETFARPAKGMAATAGVDPRVVASAYNFPPGDAVGEGIAIILLGGGFDADDLEPYFTGLGLSVPKITIVELAGQTNDPAPASKIQDLLNGVPPDKQTLWTIEASLDVQLIGTLANGAHISVYFAPNSTQGKLEAIARAALDGASVISGSFGLYETDAPAADLQAIDMTSENAGLLGVSVCVSSGDRGDGSEGGPNPRVRFPASSPNVIACGGTHAVFDTAGMLQETVWNELFAGVQFSSGGGVSGLFPTPWWQAGAGIPGKTGGRIGRGVPDVAAKADLATGYPIRVRGFTFPTGGTSAAAPLWASLCARLNENLGVRIGHLTPLLYTPAFANALRDVVAGNNGTFFTAQPDWDACTGLGSPDGLLLLTALS